LKPLKRGIGTEKMTNGVNGVNGTLRVNGANGLNGVNGINGINGTSKRGPFPFPTEGESGNPTIVPKAFLDKFHFTFLIRDPHSSIPSYFRCTIPPLSKMTGFHEFYPNEAGYDELRRFFDYARGAGLVQEKDRGLKNGAGSGDHVNGHADVPEVCVVDADDLLDNPEGILRAYCKSVGLDFDPDMMNWDNEEDQKQAKTVFQKWKGFHEDAIDSTDLKPRAHVRTYWAPNVVPKLTEDRKRPQRPKSSGMPSGKRSMVRRRRRQYERLLTRTWPTSCT
jgi:hypothetical protein